MELMDKKEVTRLLNGRKILKDKETELWEEMEKVHDGMETGDHNLFRSLANEHIVFAAWCMGGSVDLCDFYHIADKNGHEVGVGGSVSVTDFYVGDTECHIAEIASKGADGEKRVINVMDLDAEVAMLVAGYCHNTLRAKFCGETLNG